MSNTGKIVQVIGPVVDVQFAENAIPPIYQALTIDFTVNGKKEMLTLEIQQHLGGGVARTIAMSSSEARPKGLASRASIVAILAQRINDATGRPAAL